MEVKNKEDLIDSAIEQIKDDINEGDYTVIAELLEFLPEKSRESSLFLCV